MRKLSKVQVDMLTVLLHLPARYRVNGVAGGIIKYQYVGGYDGRILAGLVNRRLIEYTTYGLRINTDYANSILARQQ